MERIFAVAGRGVTSDDVLGADSLDSGFGALPRDVGDDEGALLLPEWYQVVVVSGKIHRGNEAVTYGEVFEAHLLVGDERAP